MHITKKIDRAFQWAGEKMGQEARTGVSDEFKMLETEMALRHDGMDKLQRSMNVYTKSLSRRCDAADDKEKGLPVSFLGRTMISHGEDFEPDSEFGNCLVAMGQGNERIAGLQETYTAQASSYWLEGCERNLAMMKEYQNARKKLENRRLAYDASTTKLQKAKREDFRLEDELRTSKAKYEESSEDVFRRMQDIKEAEAEAIQDLTNFLDSELEYYERCAEEMRRVRAAWPAASAASGQPSASRGGQSEYGLSRRTSRPRSNTAQSFGDRGGRTERWATRQETYEEEEAAPEPVRMPIRSVRQASSGTATPVSPARPGMSRAMTHQATFEGPRDRAYREPPLPPPSQDALRKVPTLPTNIGSLRGNLRPVSRIYTDQNSNSPDVFADDYDTNTSSGSPDYDRSESPATSYGSLSRTTSNTLLGKKAPPPPPPSRAKKPPPPIPQKREMIY